MMLILVVLLLLLIFGGFALSKALLWLALGVIIFIVVRAISGNSSR